MTRSRVSGSKLSSARPFRTRETVDACTFAARATSVIVTRLVAKPFTPGGNRLFSTIRSETVSGSAVDLPPQLVRCQDVDVPPRDADETTVLEVSKHLVDRHTC